MTVSNETIRADAAGNGTTATYSYGFRITNEDDLRVEVTSAAGAVTVLQKDVDYTVTGVYQKTGGTVVLTAGKAWMDASGFLATGWTIAIRFLAVLTQPLATREQGEYFPGQWEDTLDRVVRQIQQVNAQVQRCLRVSGSEQAALDVIPTVRANKVVAFDANGLPVVSTLTLTQLEAQPALALASAAEAEASAAAAAAALDAIDDRFLGAKAADPATDNDGNALTAGAFYWNTTTNQTRIYNGAAWQALPGGQVHVGETRPADALLQPGDLWIKTNYAATTWGMYRIVTVNPALDALEATINATTGVVSPSNGVLAATVTPGTDANVVLSAAQNAAYHLTLEDGAWTTNRSVITDGARRLFVASNPGVRAKTVKTAAGTGVVVAAGTTRLLLCDGTNVVNPDTNGYRLIAVQKLTTGTGAPLVLDSRTRMYRARGGGGGGGAGGVDGNGAGTSAASMAGSGAGWFDALLLNDGSAWTYTIGAAGTGGAAGANDGTAGGNTTLSNGTITLTGGGGQAGIGHTGINTSARAVGYDGGVGAVTGSPLAVVVGNGTPSTGRAIISGVLASMSTSGCCPLYGGGKSTNNGANGTAATVPGEGGGSCFVIDATTNCAGGAGFRGEIIIEEYE